MSANSAARFTTLGVIALAGSLAAGGCFGFEQPSRLEGVAGAAGTGGATAGTGGSSGSGKSGGAGGQSTGGNGAGGKSGTGGTGGDTGAAGMSGDGSEAGMGGDGGMAGENAGGSDAGMGGDGGAAGAAEGGAGAGGTAGSGGTAGAGGSGGVVCDPTLLTCVNGTDVTCHPSHWDFESNTAEGWSKDALSTNAEAGPPFVATLAHSGSHSLGHGLTTSGTGSSAAVNALVCGQGGLSLDLRGKTVTAWVYLSGPVLNADNVVQVCAVLLNRVKAVHCKVATNAVLDSWFSVSLPLDDPEDDAVSGITLFFSAGGSGGWSGFYYVDDVSIE